MNRWSGVYHSLVLFIACNLGCCIDERSDLDRLHRGPEALQWLNATNNPAALASNRFDNTADAIEFVENLYELGATKVTISEACIYNSQEVIDEEGGPWADGLVVELPIESDKRDAVTAVLRKEAIAEGVPDHDPPYDNRVFVWWD